MIPSKKRNVCQSLKHAKQHFIFTNSPVGIMYFIKRITNKKNWNVCINAHVILNLIHNTFFHLIDIEKSVCVNFQQVFTFCSKLHI